MVFYRGCSWSFDKVKKYVKTLYINSQVQIGYKWGRDEACIVRGKVERRLPRCAYVDVNKRRYGWYDNYADGNHRLLIPDDPEVAEVWERSGNSYDINTMGAEPSTILDAYGNYIRGEANPKILPEVVKNKVQDKLKDVKDHISKLKAGGLVAFVNIEDPMKIMTDVVEAKGRRGSSMWLVTKNFTMGSFNQFMDKGYRVLLPNDASGRSFNDANK